MHACMHACGVLCLMQPRHNTPIASPPQAASLFFSIYVTSILPFLSMNLMIYDRTFYSREAAGGLYPCRQVVR